MLTNLPDELLYHILEFTDLSIRGILSCQLICHRFRDLIRCSSELQYRIELSASQTIDQDEDCKSYAEKLRLLKKRETAWRTLRFQEPRSISPSSMSLTPALRQEFDEYLTETQAYLVKLIIACGVYIQPWRLEIVRHHEVFNTCSVPGIMLCASFCTTSKAAPESGPQTVDQDGRLMIRNGVVDCPIPSHWIVDLGSDVSTGLLALLLWSNDTKCLSVHFIRMTNAQPSAPKPFSLPQTIRFGNSATYTVLALRGRTVFVFSSKKGMVAAIDWETQKHTAFYLPLGCSFFPLSNISYCYTEPGYGVITIATIGSKPTTVALLPLRSTYTSTTVQLVCQDNNSLRHYRPKNGGEPESDLLVNDGVLLALCHIRNPTNRKNPRASYALVVEISALLAIASLSRASGAGGVFGKIIVPWEEWGPTNTRILPLPARREHCDLPEADFAVSGRLVLYKPSSKVGEHGGGGGSKLDSESKNPKGQEVHLFDFRPSAKRNSHLLATRDENTTIKQSPSAEDSDPALEAEYVEGPTPLPSHLRDQFAQPETLLPYWHVRRTMPYVGNGGGWSQCLLDEDGIVVHPSSVAENTDAPYEGVVPYFLSV